MNFGVVVPTWGTWSERPLAVRDAVQALEDLGFETVWFGDHIVIPDYATGISPPGWLEPLSCAFVGAGATQRIRFAIDVLVLPYRDPVWLSQLVASSDQLCGGRLTLGVGVGYIRGEFAALTKAPYERRGDVTDEYLAVLELLWRSTGPVSFHGKWVDFDEVWAEPKPAQLPFPLWVGGNAPAAYRRAALLGNGWHPLFPTPEVYGVARARILELRAAAGIEAPFTFSYSTSATRVLLAANEPVPRHGPTGLGSAPPEYNYSPVPPTASDGRPLFLGTPEQVAADVEAVREAGVDHLALRFGGGYGPVDTDDFVAQAERFMNLVVPLL